MENKIRVGFASLPVTRISISIFSAPEIDR